MRVAVVGGTGKFGRALATRLAEAGDEVVIGSRDAQRARAAAVDVGVVGAPNAEAVRGADLAVLATTAGAAVDTARSLSFESPLLCVASEMPYPVDEVRSVAERVAEVIDVPIAAGLHSLAALKLARVKPDEDAFVCGDDAEAKRLALELAAKLVGGRAIDAGPLQSARALEAMTAVLLHLNRSYKTHAGLKVTGLP